MPSPASSPWPSRSGVRGATLDPVRRPVAALLSLLIALSPLESALAQTRAGTTVSAVPQGPAGVSGLETPLAGSALVPGLSLSAPTLSGSPLLTAPALQAGLKTAAIVPAAQLPAAAKAGLPPALVKTVIPAAAKPFKPGKKGESVPEAARRPADQAERTGADERRPVEEQTAEAGKDFDGSKGAPKDKGTVSEGLSAEAVKELLTLRRDVQQDARTVLQEQMGGDVGDGILHKDLERVAARLVKAAGLPKEAVQVFIGNSFLPNAFTTITESEAEFIEEKSSVAKPFRVANVFLSLGLLRAITSEEELAFVIAHELNHNWKEHLKGFAGSHEMLGHFHEFEADYEAIKLIALAGYNPRKALDTLYQLDKAYDKLAKDYSMFSRRDKGEIAQAMERVRDVHPHADLRRANMLDHLDAALEQYKPQAVPEDPVWMQRRESSRRMSALDRFEKRARKAASEGTVDERLHKLEAFVEKETAKRKLGADEKAVVEEAYRDILKVQPDFEGTRSVELSIARGGVVSGKGLSGDLVTRQLELVQQKGGTLEDFLRVTAGLGVAARRAGALRLMGQVRTRAQLDAMYRALTHGAESLDLEPKDSGRAVAERLWRSTYRVLTLELGRPALPEEIIDELKAKLSPSWLRAYREDLQVNIVGTAFERPERRSQKLTPSQLVLRLRDLDEQRREGKEDGATVKALYKGYAEWAKLRYTEGELDVKNDRVVHRYERYQIGGLHAPSERDFLDLAARFETGWNPPPAAVRVLRRDGLYDAYVLKALDLLEEKLLATPKPQLKTAVNRYAERLQQLMRASLHGVSDLKETARVAALVWERAKLTHEAVQKLGTAGLVDDPKVIPASFMGHRVYTSKLSDELLKAIAVSVRVAVVRLNHSGRRPEADSLGALAKVVRDIETTLGLAPGEKVVLHHAAKIGRILSERPEGKREKRRADRAYMKAFGTAIPSSSYEADSTVRRLWQRRKPVQPRAMRGSDLLSLLLLTTDDLVPATTRLAAAALADKMHMINDASYGKTGEEALSMVGGHTIGRWLAEGAVRTAKTYQTLPSLVTVLLRLNDLQPGFLNPDLDEKGTARSAFRGGAGYVRRNEPLRTLARQEHPFRGVNVQWGHDLVDALDEAKAWPESSDDRFDLLDFMNSSGEFSDKLDARVLSDAQADKLAFRKWIESDEKRLARWGADKEEPMDSPFGKIMIPRAAPLRIIRNPATRAKLFDLLPESDLKEKPPRRGLRETIKAYLKLFRAYRVARKIFSAKFLNSLRAEGSLESKFYLVIEEIDRLSHEESKKWVERWDKGDFNEIEKKATYKNRPLPDYWAEALPHERDEVLKSYRLAYQQFALSVVYQLYLAFAATQEPLLALLLENYPEPTRSRDELLERVMKARRLTPGSLSFLEANKSYRQPNPVRVAEKQLLDQAITHLRRFKPADRVDLILHMSGVVKVSPGRVKELDRKFLHGDRKKWARDRVALRGVSQLKGYMTLMHPKDRSMLVRGMFFGPDSLHKEPAEVQRLYEAIVLEGRGLPKFVEETLRAYFRALTEDEKAILISNLAGTSDFDRELKGPQVIRVALKGMGVTGAKVAQVLATHRGLLPQEYADALEGFKDKAQDMVKMRAYDLMKDRLEGLADDPGQPRQVSIDDLSRLADAALPDEGPAVRRRLAKQVRYILAEEGRQVRRVDYIGPELGSGSIKVVYKVELKDGRVWVVKLRAPGAKYRTQREFDIVEAMTKDLEASGTLDLPGVHQLIDEVRELVRAEMDFRDEATKEKLVRANAIVNRPWYAYLIVGKAPYVPNPHPVYEGEDLLVEEFVPVKRFADLPERALIGASKRSIAKASIDEGAYALLHDEWLEPDAHTGNRYARKGLLYWFRTKLVMIDLGQGKASPIGLLKPLMRAGFALDYDEVDAAAAALMPTLEPGAKGEAAIRAIVAAGFAKRPDAGVVERLMDGYLEAEKAGALVKPDYAALQKGFLIFAGYSQWLPKNYLYKALQRAGGARLYKDGKVSFARLAWLAVKEAVFGRASTRAEMQSLIDQL